MILKEVPLPSIAHWKTDHFVVVYKVSRKYVWIADPAAGKFRLTREEFIKNWASEKEKESAVGVLLLLQTTPTFFEREEEKVDKSGFRYVLAYFTKYRRLITTRASSPHTRIPFPVRLYRNR